MLSCSGNRTILVTFAQSIGKENVRAFTAMSNVMHPLALLWHFSLSMDFRQCGHCAGGGCADAMRMAWRTVDRLGCGRGPAILFPSLACLSRREWREAIAIMHISQCRCRPCRDLPVEVIHVQFFLELLMRQSARHRLRRPVLLASTSSAVSNGAESQTLLATKW
jgi:hypothetical protein